MSDTTPPSTLPGRGPLAAVAAPTAAVAVLLGTYALLGPERVEIYENTRFNIAAWSAAGVAAAIAIWASIAPPPVGEHRLRRLALILAGALIAMSAVTLLSSTFEPPLDLLAELDDRQEPVWVVGLLVVGALVVAGLIGVAIRAIMAIGQHPARAWADRAVALIAVPLVLLFITFAGLNQ